MLEAVVRDHVALAAGLTLDERGLLLDLVSWMIAEKGWEVLPPLERRPEMLVVIAANASIPLLYLDRSLYQNVRSIIVRESSTRGEADWQGAADGVVTTGSVETIGETTEEWGPLAIAWDAAIEDSREPEYGRNVVIHEFAHKIDMVDGYADGAPPLRGDALEDWWDVVTDEYERNDPRPGDEVLDPYAWTNPVEFFAVATETFFCTPHRLRGAKPELYAALSGFYRQDPAIRRPAR